LGKVKRSRKRLLRILALDAPKAPLFACARLSAARLAFPLNRESRQPVIENVFGFGRLIFLF
jgi:hypothetical protein